ncbi:Aste57867_18350 [Aphanomyces stellatus]|uniref:Aste57867_18350 protein n=1 Tax=Aphanomyces stellatus TaxID=120398 RepID=A0A485LBA8_9STRA|nr:hypothetical protein As57867_018288 [Aphanomyces stellatus]VFT95086.1 Aste57867_18350 [Aphanomyces stellatus]
MVKYQGLTVRYASPDRNGNFFCVFGDCIERDVARTRRQLRSHTISHHKGFVTGKRPRTPDEIKGTRRDVQKRCKTKAKVNEEARVAEAEDRRNRELNPMHRRARTPHNFREVFDEQDATSGMGVFGHSNCILAFLPSTIPHAGGGVFTNTNLEQGEMVTQFCGDIVLRTTPEEKFPPHLNHFYAIETHERNWIVGLSLPHHGYGLGSLINRVNKYSDKNCEFVETGKNKIFVQTTAVIQAGSELLTTYSHGYHLES